MKTISVIIPCYNSEETIIKALESVAEQKFTDYEIVLVDDGSNDSTRIIVDDYIKT
jgi:glycosyltransferase involved in cell wall biosynthesis